jgi:ribosomal protein S27E
MQETKCTIRECFDCEYKTLIMNDQPDKPIKCRHCGGLLEVTLVESDKSVEERKHAKG